MRTLYSKYDVRANLAEILLLCPLSTAIISTCLSALLGITLISKFRCSVYSENFLVAAFHLLHVSLDRNHFLLSKASQAKSASKA